MAGGAAAIASFRELINAATIPDAVQVLARALNQPGPTEKHPAHSPPDVLVLIRPPPAPDETIREAFRFSDEVHTFDILFGADLAKQLKAFNDTKPWQDALGSTRILLIDDPPLDRYFPAPRLEPTTQQRIGLEELGRFRHEFTQNMASTVVGEDALGGAEIRDWLQQLVDDRLLFSIFVITHPA